MTVIALPAAGDMGAGLGRVLVANGATVLTRIQGRSAATVARADQAGMRPAEFQDIARADLILSVVPPAIAVETAQEIVAALTLDNRPIYVDLNAISPARTAEIATIVAPVAEFVDGGIIGGPPRLGITGRPVIYLSGPAERAAHLLGAHGLSVRPIEGGIGAASALKLQLCRDHQGADRADRRHAACSRARWYRRRPSRRDVKQLATTFGTRRKDAARHVSQGL